VSEQVKKLQHTTPPRLFGFISKKQDERTMPLSERVENYRSFFFLVYYSRA